MSKVSREFTILETLTYSRGHINEVEAGRRHGEEKKEGQEGAVREPQQPPRIQHGFFPLLREAATS